MENTANINYNNLENNQSKTEDKYKELVDHDNLKRYSKLYFYLSAFNLFFIVLYVIRWLFGISYLNPTPDILLENSISQKVPFLNTINCTANNSDLNPIFQIYPVVELPIHISYKRIQVDSEINKICGKYLTFSYAKNSTFNYTCNETIYFQEQSCPVSNISNTVITDLMYDATLIVNAKKEKFFVYKDKIIPNKTQQCEFIEDINPYYNSFLLPFLILIPIGLGAFAQCIFGGISLQLENKDDISRAPISSTSYTSYEKVGEINYYSGNRLVAKKDWKDYVNRVRHNYHQIAKTGLDYFWNIWILLICDGIVVLTCYYYGKIFYYFYKQVTLVIKMGSEQCFEQEYYNDRFLNYGSGIDLKAMEMGIAIATVGVLNAICFLVTFVFILIKIGFKKFLCF